MHHGPVCEGLEPHFATAHQHAGDRPPNALIAAIHEDRQLEVRPPRTPLIVVVESLGESRRRTDDEGLVDQIYEWHVRRMSPTRARLLVHIRHTSCAMRETGGEPPAVVDVRDLTVSFGPVTAVDSLDLSVPAGGGVALVGRNGAGKSTTLRVLAGVLPPTSGRAEVAGVDVRRNPTTAKEHSGYCPDVGGLIPRATPWEHLVLAARLRRLPSGWETRARFLLDRFDLAASADRITAGFSHGMSRRMSVILAAVHDPDVLLLDEPFDGVDPLGIEATLEVIADMRLRGCAVVVSTHLLQYAVVSCDEAVILRGGRVAAAAPAIELEGEAGVLRYRALLS
jgi:ABC-2 type transport system ATP-binding protein